MRRRIRTAAMVGGVLALALMRGHGAASAADGWRRPVGLVHPVEPAGPGVRIMTFNIQHGIDGSHTYRLESAIETIARLNPDVVALAEVTRNHPYYHCDDQPKLLADGLTRATGQRWHAVYQQQWFTPNTECRDSGRGDGRETEGIAFLSPEPPGHVRHIDGWNGGAGLAIESPRLPGVPIVVTHLTAQVANAPTRSKQFARLLPWMDGLGSPRILAGDLNAWPENAEMRPVLAAYRDAWAEAHEHGTARGRTDGITHGKHRTDYILYTAAGRLELLWAETVDTVPLIGREASDHRPMVAAFRERLR